MLTGEIATGKNRQLASVDALAARDSMGAIPGIGDAVPTHPQGSFPHPSGRHLFVVGTILAPSPTLLPPNPPPPPQQFCTVSLLPTPHPNARLLLDSSLMNPVRIKRGGVGNMKAFEWQLPDHVLKGYD